MDAVMMLQKEERYWNKYANEPAPWGKPALFIGKPGDKDYSTERPSMQCNFWEKRELAPKAPKQKKEVRKDSTKFKPYPLNAARKALADKN